MLVLGTLTSDPSNEVWVVSGRARRELGAWFETLVRGGARGKGACARSLQGEEKLRARTQATTWSDTLGLSGAAFCMSPCPPGSLHLPTLPTLSPPFSPFPTPPAQPGAGRGARLLHARARRERVGGAAAARRQRVAGHVAAHPEAVPGAGVGGGHVGQRLVDSSFDPRGGQQETCWSKTMCRGGGA